jgi:hypothetical protein
MKMATMLRNAKEYVTLLKLMELYFETRLSIASSVPGDVYQKEFVDAKTVLSNTWKVAQDGRPSLHG